MNRLAFVTNVQQDIGETVKNVSRVHIVLSLHLKPCQYLQDIIDLLRLPEGPELYSVLIDYVDSLCSVWTSCPSLRDLRP